MLPQLALTLALAQAPAAAQPAVSTQQFDAPAYVSVVDGGATLERDGRVESSPLNMPLLAGDRLKTTDGRVEIRFADGGRLQLDSRTSLDMLSDELVRLGDGRIRLSVQRAQQVNYRVDSAVGSVRVLQSGEYRLAILHTAQEVQLEFAVVRGAGEIFTDLGTTAVRAGERAYSSAGLAPSYAYTYNSAALDEFDRWAEMQTGTVYAASSESSQYLPADMSGYASTFDQYGDWRYEQTYGQVWYPRVAAGWRPYYYGRWSPYPGYGWTWIAGDPFGYPTHHYGRWGISAGGWFWIPSRAWGPAYVSWGYAPSYVSWCPLGWNNVAVFSLGYYNVGPAYYAGHYGGHYYSAWTTVPHAYFGRGYYAHQHAVNWDRAGYNGPRARFTESGAGPATRDFAVARGTAAPIRNGGTRAAAPAFAAGRTPSTGVDTARPRATASASSAVRDPGGRRTTPETPRYINRGEQIVRSQSERPTAPPDRRSTAAQGFSGGGGGRDTAIARTAPQGAASAVTREGRAGDNPAYRPGPSMNDPSRAYAPTYDRAAPRTQVPYGPRTYDRPSAGDRTYTTPYAGDRVYDRPSVGDRAYSRPNVGDRAYERPSAGRVESPRAMERSAPPPPQAAPPPAAQPMGRAPGFAPRSAPPAPAAPSAPATRPGGGGGGAGDRAVPRSGGGPAGGGQAASAPSGGHRGRGR
jgi:hypothetical protein